MFKYISIASLNGNIRRRVVNIINGLFRVELV